MYSRFLICRIFIIIPKKTYINTYIKKLKDCVIKDKYSWTFYNFIMVLIAGVSSRSFNTIHSHWGKVRRTLLLGNWAIWRRRKDANNHTGVFHTDSVKTQWRWKLNKSTRNLNIYLRCVDKNSEAKTKLTLSIDRLTHSSFRHFEKHLINALL